MKPIISKEVENVLLALSKKIDTLFSEEALLFLKNYKVTDTEPSGKREVFEKLLEQLPQGIYINTIDIQRLVETSQKRNGTEVTSYSPFTIEYKEFDPCSPMKFGDGNIITGRDQEVEKILTTLCRKDKRGIILIGDPGVGKTAVVRSVASKLIQGTVPRRLKGCQILSMNIPLIFSKYKEDPIGVIVKILETASKYDKAILFIDEVHQLLGHRMNDILKPYLTEKMRFIGATTINEYHSIITDDTALERRFTIISIPEPSVEQTIAMVTGTKSIFENDHRCIIPNETIEYLVKTGNRFLGHRRNPDKSLDILDIACTILFDKEIIKTYDKHERTDNIIANARSVINEIKSFREESGSRKLTKDYVNSAISSLTNINFQEVSNSLDYDRVLSTLKSTVFGQDKQLESISNVVNIFKSVTSERTRPVSVLLLAGPKGCGKKLACKELAKILFGNKDHFITYPMGGLISDFMITELKGAPPGYVGYKSSGSLIKQIRNSPQSVVYFKDIDKANQSIVQYILDSCRQGTMIDSAEREASLVNTIIVFGITLSDSDLEQTSKKSQVMGFGVAKNDIIDINERLKKILPTEIIDAVDEIIVFNKLTPDVIEKIYNANVENFTKVYNVNIDLEVLKQQVLKDTEDGAQVINKLSSDVSKLAFEALKEKNNEKIKISDNSKKNDKTRSTRRSVVKTDPVEGKQIEDSKKTES